MASIRLDNNGTIRDISLTGTATEGSRIIVGGTGTELTTDISKTNGSPLLLVGIDKYIREKYSWWSGQIHFASAGVGSIGYVYGRYYGWINPATPSNIIQSFVELSSQFIMGTSVYMGSSCIISVNNSFTFTAPYTNGFYGLATSPYDFQINTTYNITLTFNS